MNLRGEPRSSKVSAREMQVAELISRGLENKEIAWEMGLSEGTIKVHIRNLKHKVGSLSRVKIALWYLGERTVKERKS